MNILVLDGHSRAAVEALQALGRAHANIDISAESADALAFCSAYPRQRIIQPSTVDHGNYIAWLEELDALNKYSLIIPSTESSLIALNELPDDHPLRSKSVIASRAAIDVALDKQKTYELAAQLHIPVPRSHLIASPDDATPPGGFPVVMKPVHSKIVIGGQLLTISTAVVSDDHARKGYLDAWWQHTPIQESEYFSGRGIGIEFLYDKGIKCWHFAHERIHECPLTGGASSYRRAIAPPAAMLADAESLLQALNWHGVAMVEFKLNGAGEYRLLEINPRLWGSLALPIDAGINFPLGLLALALGQTVAAQPPYRVGYYTRDLLEDIDWFRENLQANHGNPLLMTRPRFRSFLEFFRPLFGKESWDHFDFADLGVTFAIIRRIFTTCASALMKRISRLAHMGRSVKNT